MNAKEEKRRHPRCCRELSISVSYLNKTEQHTGLTRNYSRFGLYFESEKTLAPGTLIVIRTTNSLFSRASPEQGSTQEQSAGERGDGGRACREMKSLVTAQVKRCVENADPHARRYGIAVEYVHPAV